MGLLIVSEKSLLGWAILMCYSLLFSESPACSSPVIHLLSPTSLLWQYISGHFESWESSARGRDKDIHTGKWILNVACVFLGVLSCNTLIHDPCWGSSVLLLSGWTLPWWPHYSSHPLLSPDADGSAGSIRKGDTLFPWALSLNPGCRPSKSSITWLLLVSPLEAMSRLALTWPPTDFHAARASLLANTRNR